MLLVLNERFSSFEVDRKERFSSSEVPLHSRLNRFRIFSCPFLRLQIGDYLMNSYPNDFRSMNKFNQIFQFSKESYSKL